MAIVEEFESPIKFLSREPPLLRRMVVLLPQEMPILKPNDAREIIQQALEDLDADLSCVVRTRMFVTDINRWAEFGKAHHEYFATYPPATTMVEVQRLIDPEMLIEIEVDAIVVK